MKTLIIAEKPAVARDIATALGGFQEQSGHGGKWLERADTIISSAVGHLVELACPEADDPGYDLAKLPAMPKRFNLAPIPRTEGQLKLLRKLLHREDVGAVVNACDAGREGELIFRYVYLFCGCTKQMHRMWLQSMTANAIKQAHARLQTGREYDSLFAAAQSRAEADWLIGVNGTRAVSIPKSAEAGHRVKATVGRVQTPVVALVVDRELAIRRFVPKAYWEIHGTFSTKAGRYVGKWTNPSFVADPKNPEAKAERLWTKVEAVTLMDKCTGQHPSDVKDTSTEVLSHAPKLFDLTTLQREANRKCGFSAKKTLDLAQALYEKHKVLTYPRTDSSALPEDYIPMAQATLSRLGESGLPFAPFAQKATHLVRPDKRIFNDAKISDHFAIIPTGTVSRSLSLDEAAIYELVAKRFVAVFFPPAKYLQTIRLTTVAGEIFRSSGRVLVEQGWLAVYGKEVDDQDEPALCALGKNEIPGNEQISLVSLKTTPPARYTEASLLGAMETAGADIEDDDIRSAMTEKGLGTPATRASILEKILDPDVGYLVRQKKLLVPTEKAFDLVDFLRTNGLSALTTAQTTGEWEAKLRLMEKGRFPRPAFMAEISDFTRNMVQTIRASVGDLPTGGIGKAPAGIGCPNCSAPLEADSKAVSCPACSFKLWRQVAKRELSMDEVTQLIRAGSLPKLEGFVSGAGKPFSAGLRLIGLAGKVEFIFDGKPATTGSGEASRPRSGAAQGSVTPTTAQRLGASAVGRKCPDCNKGSLIGRRTGDGKAFIGCTNFPACRHFEWAKGDLVKA